MIIYGTVLSLESNRMLILKTRKQIYKIKLQRSQYYKYEALLSNGKRLVGVLRKDKELKLTRILKIFHENGKALKPLFHQNHIVSDVKHLLNQLDYVLTLDFEMSMHPYYYSKEFVSEIIQVGYVLTSGDGTLIETYEAYIKPTQFPKLTPRTLKFLDITQNDVDNGISFVDFYHHFDDVIQKYQPGIIVWGGNDENMLHQTLKNHGFEDGSIHLRFIDLLKLHKQVYMYKNDLGLLNAYKMYGHHVNDPQRHDAFDDALMTEKVFQGFKKYLNQKTPALSSYYLYD